MNVRAALAIYKNEMARFFRTLFQSIFTPVLTTSLYFIVFGSAIGSRMQAVSGVTYAAYIIPGLVMLSVLTESTANASFGIYMPKFAGTIYEILSAPLAATEAILGYVGAAATKSLFLSAVMLLTARFFVPFEVAHPLHVLAFLVCTALAFSMLGFLIGIWADSWEKLQVVPTMILSPLTFLGGTFYSIDMLPPAFRTLSLFNPVVYLVSGFRYAFFGVSDVPVAWSWAAAAALLLLTTTAVHWVFRTGYRLRA